VAAWNKQAELCSRFLSKGRRVAVDGRLRSRSWEDAEGRRRTAIEVVAHTVQFLSSPEERRSETETPFQQAATP
jgi:single-strand DNA-binding protein